MNTMKHITRYARGELSEEEAMRLWVELMKNPEEMELLELYLTLRNYGAQTFGNQAG